MVFLGKGDFLFEVSTGRQFRMLKLHRLNALRKTKLQLLQVLHCFRVGFCYLIFFNALSWLYFNLRLSFQHLAANQENPSLNYRYYDSMSSICWLYQNWWVSRLKEKITFFDCFWIFLFNNLTGISFFMIFVLFGQHICRWQRFSTQKHSAHRPFSGQPSQAPSSRVGGYLKEIPGESATNPDRCWIWPNSWHCEQI